MRTPDAAHLRSVHTSTFPALLDQLGVSVLVSTYQAGKLVVLRSDGGVLNTHFRDFRQPMGLALAGNRLAVGTANHVREFQNVPAVARRLPPPGRPDACFLPRRSHVTGNVAVHEMAWVNGEHVAELWFVNTRFSCLCTLDPLHSFVPRWRPPFITALAPEDRCHLNGLGLAGGVPRLASVLGTTDTPGGWRANKRNGGALLDVPSGEVVVAGLSMPHSPRCHADRLWLLESGAGTLGVVDAQAGKYEPLTVLPGFTRGLDFSGRYAFVGLSQVRESAVFSGIAVAERPERYCGVWVVDLASGKIAAFVRFEEAVQEIFAVQVLPRMRFPDLINDDQDLIADSFVLPDEALGAVPEELRSAARPG
jgi:uncharacterized protein (TIGR03032 family)